MTTAKQPAYVRTVYISLLIIIVVFFMIMAKKILVPLLLSGYIAMVLTSLCNRLEKYKIPRSLAAFAALLLFLAMVVAILWLIITQVERFVDDMESDVLERVNQMFIGLNSFLIDYAGINIGMQRGFDAGKLMAMVHDGEKNSTQLILMTLGTVSNIVLIPVFIFFWLIYRDHFAVFITKVFAKERNKILMEHVVAIRKIMHDYVSGAGKVMIILGIVNSAILLMLGIKHAIFFGFTAGLLNIIPYLGPLIGAILPFFFALLTKDSYFYPIAIVVSFTVVQFLEGTFLTPKITGSNVNLNAFVTVIALLIGGAIWGIPGMIIIIPTIAILKKLFELSPATEPYAYLFGEEDSRWFRRKHG